MAEVMSQRLGQRNVGRIEAHLPHRHLDLTARFPDPAADHARERAHREFLPADAASVEQVAREDPQAVAALLRLRAVGVENAQPLDTAGHIAR